MVAIKLPALPAGKAGAAIKAVLGALLAFWWTSGPGADEARHGRALARPLSLGFLFAAVSSVPPRLRLRRSRLTPHRRSRPPPARPPPSLPRSQARGAAEKRQSYNRHHAFKGRARKENLREDAKDERSEIGPTRAYCAAT